MQQYGSIKVHKIFIHKKPRLEHRFTSVAATKSKVFQQFFSFFELAKKKVSAEIKRMNNFCRGNYENNYQR